LTLARPHAEHATGDRPEIEALIRARAEWMRDRSMPDWDNAHAKAAALAGQAGGTAPVRVAVDEGTGCIAGVVSGYDHTPEPLWPGGGRTQRAVAVPGHRVHAPLLLRAADRPAHGVVGARPHPPARPAMGTARHRPVPPPGRLLHPRAGVGPRQERSSTGGWRPTGSSAGPSRSRTCRSSHAARRAQ